MSAFTMNLQDATHAETIAGVTDFVGADASGSFGIRAGHVRMMTILTTGLARFRVGAAPWRYLALPGGVLGFDRNVLTLSTRRYLLDDDYQRISSALGRQLRNEEEQLRVTKQSLRRLEEEALRRLWELHRRPAG